MIECINTLEPYLKIYPADEEVFADPVERYARHLMPFVSIDLSAVNPEWQGWIHVVSSVEPADGVVGEDTHDFHNEFLCENWIGFRLNNAGRYELLGDFHYFYLENSPESLTETYSGQREELEEHYATQHSRFKTAKERFARHGVFYSDNRIRYLPADHNLSEETPARIIDQLGGGVSWGIGQDLQISHSWTPATKIISDHVCPMALRFTSLQVSLAGTIVNHLQIKFYCFMNPKAKQLFSLLAGVDTCLLLSTQ